MPASQRKHPGGGSVETPVLIPGVNAGGLNVLRPGLLLLVWASFLLCNLTYEKIFFHVPVSLGNCKN